MGVYAPDREEGLDGARLEPSLKLEGGSLFDNGGRPSVVRAVAVPW